MPLFDDKDGISEYSLVVGFPDRKLFKIINFLFDNTISFVHIGNNFIVLFYCFKFNKAEKYF